MISFISSYNLCKKNIAFSSKLNDSDNCFSRVFLTPVTLQTISALELATRDVLTKIAENNRLKSTTLDEYKNLSIENNSLILSDSTNNSVILSFINDLNNSDSFMITTINKKENDKYSLVFSNNKLIEILDGSGEKNNTLSITAKEIEAIIIGIGDCIDSYLLSIRQFINNPYRSLLSKKTVSDFNLPGLSSNLNSRVELSKNQFCTDMIKRNTDHRIELDDEIVRRKNIEVEKKL